MYVFGNIYDNSFDNRGTYDYFLKRRPILLEKNHNKKEN